MKRHFITIIIVLAAMCGGASAQQKQGHVMRPKTRGVGKTIQAIGTAELMRKEKLIQSALIVCPTSLKYQWKREIERLTGQQAHVIEGLHHKRVTQYQLDVPYKIISYNSAYNDIKILGKLDTDLLIMDEVQRLKNWNTQISMACAASGRSMPSSFPAHPWRTNSKNSTL